MCLVRKKLHNSDIIKFSCKPWRSNIIILSSWYTFTELLNNEQQVNSPQITWTTATTEKGTMAHNGGNLLNGYNYGTQRLHNGRRRRTISSKSTSKSTTTHTDVDGRTTASQWRAPWCTRPTQKHHGEHEHHSDAESTILGKKFTPTSTTTSMTSTWDFAIWQNPSIHSSNFDRNEQSKFWLAVSVKTLASTQTDPIINIFY